MKLPRFLPALWVAAVALTGCERQTAPPLASSAPPQVVVLTVERRDVPIVREWIGSLDGSANVDVRARVQGYVQEVAFKGRGSKRATCCYASTLAPWKRR